LCQTIGLSLSLLALGVLAGCGGGKTGGMTDPGQPPPTATASGTVTYLGAPLAGATVWSYCTNTNVLLPPVTTDANGSYTFTGLEASADVPTDYQFFATKDGYGIYPSASAPGQVLRCGYNGMFQGNNINDVAITFNVVDYVTSATAPLAAGDFKAYDGANPRVSLARTGQSTSYAAGDDGAVQAGVAWPATRFTDNGDGTVTDQVTGLIWLKNAGSFSATTWPQALAEVAQLANGAAGLSDGSQAGQWRVPNLVELESLVDPSASNPALTAGNPFTNVSNTIPYWSSTSYWGGAASPSAWIIRFGDGTYDNDGVVNAKATANNSVWAVKGKGGGTVNLQASGQYDAEFNASEIVPGDDGGVLAGVPLNYPRFVDQGDGTVLDTETGLIWLKQADAFNLSWGDTLAAIATLQSGQKGLTDGSRAGAWRMPNRKEMQSLADRFMNNHCDYFNASFTTWSGLLFQPPIFNNFMISQFYWTSSTDAADPAGAWTTYSCDFGVYETLKTSLGYSLAVR
jgi:hypothetical protein